MTLTARAYIPGMLQPCPAPGARRFPLGSFTAFIPPAVFMALTALTCVFTLTACGGPRTALAPREADPAPLKAFAARGYEAVVHDEPVASRHDWPLGPVVQHVQLLRPSPAGAADQAEGLPVIVYLPGLGETADAGGAWRRAWATAGYAVLSVQPLPEDATAFQSDLARDGAFRTLGQQRHAAAAMLRRVQALVAVLAEARRRGQTGLAADSAWAGLDWQRVAVAGYDLGAHSAMVLAGEQLRGADGLPGLMKDWSLRAVIALSPYADIADGGLATRYSGIRLPVLSITSEADNDPLGVVAGAAQRQAPFEHTAGPGQFLLTLQGLAHARLSGSVVTPGSERPPAARGNAEGSRGEDGNGSGAGTDNGSGRGRSGGGGGGGGGGGQRGQRGQGGGGAMAPGAARTPGGTNAAGPNTVAAATATQLRLIAAQDVSTAFLDAQLRGDSVASAWLRDHAPAWLGTAGELRQK